MFRLNDTEGSMYYAKFRRITMKVHKYYYTEPK